jgi:hypothetical protein
LRVYFSQESNFVDKITLTSHARVWKSWIGGDSEGPSLCESKHTFQSNCNFHYECERKSSIKSFEHNWNQRHWIGKRFSFLVGMMNEILLLLFFELIEFLFLWLVWLKESEISFMIFCRDLRLKEVQRLLKSSVPIRLKLKEEGLNDQELLQVVHTTNNPTSLNIILSPFVMLSHIILILFFLGSTIVVDCFNSTTNGSSHRSWNVYTCDGYRT